MNQRSASELAAAKCLPCEGGVDPLTPASVALLVQQTPEWTVTADGLWIRRRFNLNHFAAALKLVNAIAEIAEAQHHHPDLHLTGYRHLTVELTTHAIGGLSENDFILAAKIDELA